MTLALAKALAPQNCHQEPFNPQRDLRALQTLAAWCLRFTPSVGLDHELRLAHARHELQQLNKLHWGLTLDLTGTEKLHRDLTQLTESLHLAFKGSASVALAPTIGAAWALSRYQTKAASVARSITALNSLVANLPSEALRIDLKTCDALAELGIYTVSDILNLPRQSLSQRFGKQLTYRLAQLTGAIDERVYPISPTKRQQKQRLFEPPLTNRRSITQAIEALFQALIKDLKQAHIAAKLFELIVTDTSSKTTHKNLLLASATNDAKHLESVIQPIIDSISFCGEVKLISIEAKDTIYITHKQSDFYNENSPSSEAIERSYSELINSFSVKIGRDRVLRARLTQSYTPELAFHYCSAADQYQAPQFSPSYDPNQRPTVLFSRPEPITTIALLPDKPPSWIRWRSINLAIISGFGQEPICRA
jgi:protein ImuB